MHKYRKGTDSPVALRLTHLEWCKTGIAKSESGDSFVRKVRIYIEGEDCGPLGRVMAMSIWGALSSHPMLWGSVGPWGAVLAFWTQSCVS